MPQSPYYALSRLEISTSRTFGWQVRLQRRGEKYGKFFSDAQYGSSSAAKQAALVYRDELLIRLKEQSGVRVASRSERNQSGVIGVALVTAKASNGVEYQFWQASWSSRPGVRQIMRFSVKKYGSQKAFQLAVKARKNAVKRSS